VVQACRELDNALVAYLPIAGGGLGVPVAFAADQKTITERAPSPRSIAA
jgi:hypothetical protein